MEVMNCVNMNHLLNLPNNSKWDHENIVRLIMEQNYQFLKMVFPKKMKNFM